MLGLERKKVILVEHDDEWISNYESESTAIRDALGDLVIDIQHFGSTSVPGLKAKPIIDILVGIQSFDKIDLIIKQMESLDYTYAHWAGIPDDYTFRKGDKTTYLVHIVIYKTNNWNHNITFRDKLRNDSALFKQYENLKEGLAKKYPDSREKYTMGKSKFIEDTLNG